MARNKNSLQQKTSRYAAGGSTSLRGNKLGWWERETYSFSESDTVFVVYGRYDRRPDLIASDFLGKASLGWVILQYNNIVDVETELAMGETIRIPSQSRVNLQIL